MTASKELLQMIDDWADGFTDYLKTQPLVQKIQEKAKTEDIDDDSLRKLIESALTKRGLSDRTINRNLPAELKRTYSERKPKLDTMSNVEKSTSKMVQIKQNVAAQDVEIVDAPTVKEGTDIIASTAKQIAASVQPNPEESPDNDPTPDFPQPTDEPDDGTESKKENLPRWIRIELTKTIGNTSVTFAKKIEIIMQSGGIAYFGILDNNVIGIESAGEYLRKQSAMEVRTQ